MTQISGPAPSLVGLDGLFEPAEALIAQSDIVERHHVSRIDLERFLRLGDGLLPTTRETERRGHSVDRPWREGIQARRHFRLADRLIRAPEAREPLRVLLARADVAWAEFDRAEDLPLRAGPVQPRGVDLSRRDVCGGK